MLTVVSIVGAGPGAPDLLTVRAVRRLAHADVVFYDGLVPAEMLAEFAPRARHICVSRRPGMSRVSPTEAAALMIEAAKAGEQVVRLRAGDPFVLARGAEELLTLVAAGVSFDLVPGLTSALAAATLTGIPLTHRGVSSAVVIVSGHAAEAYTPVLESLLPASATLVVLMGLAERDHISAALLARGWPGTTPLAIVTSASQPTERIYRTTLGRVAVDIAGLSAEDPGVIIIGEVVDVGVTLARAMTSRNEDILQEVAWQR
jgi:uroporphyrin-III C-methyltransferase